MIIQTPISRIDFPAPQAAFPLASRRQGLFPRPTANQDPARPAEASDWSDRRLDESGAAFRSAKNFQTEVCRNQTGHLLDFHPFMSLVAMLYNRISEWNIPEPVNHVVTLRC